MPKPVSHYQYKRGLNLYILRVVQRETWMASESVSSGDKKNPDLQDKGAGNAFSPRQSSTTRVRPTLATMPPAVPAPHPPAQPSTAGSLLQLLPISLTKPARATRWVLPRFAPIAPPKSTKKSSELAHSNTCSPGNQICSCSFRYISFNDMPPSLA